MSSQVDDYLEKKLRRIVEPLISSLLMDRPKEPVNKINNIDSFYD